MRKPTSQRRSSSQATSVLPQICHLVPQGGLPVAADLLLHARRSLQIRLARGPADRRAVAAGQLRAVRNARRRGHCRQFCSSPYCWPQPPGFAGTAVRRATLPLLAGVVLFYQTAGALGEWAFTGSAAAAVQDFRIGIPGMLAQAAGGYLTINYLLRK